MEEDVEVEESVEVEEDLEVGGAGVRGVEVRDSEVKVAETKERRFAAAVAGEVRAT